MAGAPAERPAPEAIPRSDPARPAEGGSLAENVLIHALAHPGSSATQITGAVHGSKSTVYRALRLAVEAGTLRVEGARYFPASQGDRQACNPTVAPPAPAAPAPELDAAVAAFVAAHPGCKLSDLREATAASGDEVRAALAVAKANGVVRMEGTRFTTRYFPVMAASGGRAPRTTAAPPSSPKGGPATVQAAPERPMTTVTHLGAARVSADVAGRAEAVMNELDAAVAEDMHAIRFGALLQALVAETKQLRPQIPDDHRLALGLDRLIRRVTAIRSEQNLGFIVGLKRDAAANWPAVARDARQRVAKFDLDAEAPAVSRTQTRGPKASKSSPSPEPEVREELAHLAALTKPVMLVGGIKKNEVLEAVKAHHGLRVEWAAMQGSNARAAEHLVDRIRKGNVGAVAMLEGLTGTTQVRMVIEACKDGEVPYAYGDRAGTASLRGALVELNGSVGAREAS